MKKLIAIAAIWIASALSASAAMWTVQTHEDSREAVLRRHAEIRLQMSRSQINQVIEASVALDPSIRMGIDHKSDKIAFEFKDGVYVNVVNLGKHPKTVVTSEPSVIDKTIVPEPATPPQVAVAPKQEPPAPLQAPEPLPPVEALATPKPMAIATPVPIPTPIRHVAAATPAPTVLPAAAMPKQQTESVAKTKSGPQWPAIGGTGLFLILAFCAYLVLRKPKASKVNLGGNTAADHLK